MDPVTSLETTADAIHPSARLEKLTSRIPDSSNSDSDESVEDTSIQEATLPQQLQAIMDQECDDIPTPSR